MEPRTPDSHPPAVRLGSVAIPSEHGGWSLTAEPALLGLLVEPSIAGVMLALGGVLAFIIRTPLKVAVGDRLRRRRLPRTVIAERIAGAELLLLIALAAGATVGAHRSFWVPLALAGPLIGIGLWYDVRARSRRFAAEIAATVGIAAVGASIVLAGGGEVGTAFGVWLVAAARSLAAVTHVRVQLRRAKGQAYNRFSSDAAQVVAVAVVAVGAALGLLPIPAPIVIGALAVFHTVALRCCEAPRAAILGAQQVVWGLTVVLIVGLSIAAP